MVFDKDFQFNNGNIFGPQLETICLKDFQPGKVETSMRSRRDELE